MISKVSKFIALAGVLVGLMMVRAVPASAGAYNETFDISPNVQDCDGDWVDLTGTAHVVANITSTKSGRLNINGQLNAKTSGSDSNGDANFQGSAESNFSLHVDTNTDGLFVVSFPFSIKLIGQGTEPNFVLHGTLHLTVNANDDVTAAVFNFTGGCQ
jgi:hypothetical protein